MRSHLSIYAAVMLVCATVVAHAQEIDTGAVVRLAMHESDWSQYRITMKTSSTRYFPHSDMPSDYKRELTYWLTQRVISIGKDGIMSVEANIDSMRLSADKGGDHLSFDSQDFHAAETMDLSHPELVGTTMILNKPFTYRMTLEGDYIDQKGFESWIGQIDSAIALDTSIKNSLKEYMVASFLRRLVVPHEGFVFERKYMTKQEWSVGLTRPVFCIPAVDSARMRIEFPTTHKRFFIFTSGDLHMGARELRDHGFKETSIIDSLHGTMRDTTVLSATGVLQELERSADMKVWLHTDKLAYSEDIREETIIRLEGYERR